MSRNNSRKILISLMLIATFIFAGRVYAQQKTEILKLGILEISHPVFNPNQDKELVISGEMLYLTQSGTFGAPEVVAKISNLELELGVSLTPMSLDDLPEEYKALAKRWAFKVRWNGLDRHAFPVDSGRYQCFIVSKVLKTIITNEVQEDGTVKEIKEEKESEERVSASILIINDEE